MLKIFNSKNKEKTKLRLSSESGAGFTLVEIMVAMAILAIILSIGLFISWDFYKSYAFHAEKNIIISTLQRARNQSLNNINQVRHGVHFENAPPLRYIIYECPGNTLPCSYVPSTSDIIIDASYSISIINPSPLPDIVFDQLSGDCIITPTFDCLSTNPIRVSDSVKSYDISINSEGQISW